MDRIAQRFLTAPLRHLCLLCGSSGLLAEFVVNRSRILYDESGIRGLFFWLAQGLQLPFWQVSNFLFFVNHGQAVPFHDAITAIWGLSLCALADFLIRQMFFQKRNGHPSQ